MCRKQMVTQVIFITGSISPHLPQSLRFPVSRKYVTRPYLLPCLQTYFCDISPSTLFSFNLKRIDNGLFFDQNKANETAAWEKRNKKVTWLGKKGISKTEGTLSSLTGAPLHINERLGRNYILLPVRIHMPNYNIFIKWECNFHKGDYKGSTRSGKAFSVLCISLGWWCWCCQNVPHCSLALLKDYVFSVWVWR